MKKILTIAILACSFAACKKEKTETPATTPGTISATKHCTATINTNTFSASSYIIRVNPFDKTKYSVASFGGVSGIIALEGKIKTGTFNIGYIPSLYTASYQINNKTYNAFTGKVTISQLDTLGGAIKKFKATFNFNTDTISAIYYQVTNGDLNYFE